MNMIGDAQQFVNYLLERAWKLKPGNYNFWKNLRKLWLKGGKI